MEKASMRWGRLALATTVVMLAVGFVVPGVAFAKSTTRIVVTKSVTADWSTGTVSPSKSVTAKLQKKSGTKWVSLKGTVKVYYHNSSTTTWTYKFSKTGSSVSIPLNARGRYKLYYAGSSTAKSTTSYTQRLDKIGETISDAVVDFAQETSSDGTTWTVLTVSYDVNWNTHAYWISPDAPLEFSYVGTFENLDGYYSGDVWFYQQIWEPGTAKFSYRVRNTDIGSDMSLDTLGRILSDDDYVVTSASKSASSAF